MGNKVRKVFNRNKIFVGTSEPGLIIPAGVKEIHVWSVKEKETLGGSCFVDVYKNLYSWGQNTNGFGAVPKVGNANGTTNVSTPTQIAGAIKWRKCWSTSQVRYFLDDEGKLYATGSGFQQNGIATSPTVSTPTQVAGNVRFMKGWFLGSNTFGQHWALGEDSYLYFWGYNGFGQGGINSVALASTPTLVLGPQFRKIDHCKSGFGNKMTVAGLAHPSNQLFLWGSNHNGQHGNNGSVTDTSIPSLYAGPESWIDVAVASEGQSVVGTPFVSVAGITKDYELKAWGHGGYGQVGNGTTTTTSTPTLVSGSTKFDRVWGGAQGNFYAREKDTGRLYSWGYNAAGQLGQNDTTNRSSPTLIAAIPAGEIPVKVYAGFGMQAVLTHTGKLYTWGGNFVGSLGQGSAGPADFVTTSSPALTAGAGRFKDFATDTDAGGDENHFIAVDFEGKVYTWGTNMYGELGTALSDPFYPGEGFGIGYSTPTLVFGAGQLGKKTVDIEPVVKYQVVPVTPGTSYPVFISQMQARMGDTTVGGQRPIALGQDFPDEVIVEYET